MTTHNLDGVKQLESMGFSRVVLSRELNLNEIENIRKNSSVELEVFIHGALCISYSGQCLLSSMIGGRSGNRGLCAQPCRLPYELIETNYSGKESILDKGYLLSPRDNCGIEFLPELIKMGINSLKIEGRMKSPIYVGTVTKIYRKYIDLILNNIELDNITLKKIINENLNIKNKETNLSDKEELLQVFNRGEFSTGHFNNLGNKNLIFKFKPNNMGIYIGKISKIFEKKAYVSLKLEHSLSIGDKISINNNIYNISELMKNSQNFETLEKGSIVTIGRIKGDFSLGTKIYKLESKNLNRSISPTFKENKDFKKIIINGEITIKENLPITLKIYSDSGFYRGLEFTATSNNFPSIAINNSITKENIFKQILKTGNTEFEFANLKIDLDNNLFVPMGVINDLRRTALKGLENLVLEKYSHNLNSNLSNNIIFNTFNIRYNKTEHTKNVSLLLNILDENFDYTSLTKINKIYIPLKYFINNKFKNILNSITQNFNTYIYMPNIIKNKNLDSIDFEKIISEFDIKGFVISHISQIEKFKKYNLELIGNYTLNIYNSFSIEKLKNLGFSYNTTSPELELTEMNSLNQLSLIPCEVIVYGKIPVMTNNYCYLGKTNNCYSECDKKCLQNKIYHLKDRTNAIYRIIPDNSSTITTIYNYKPINLNPKLLDVSSIRIDILDEDVKSIQNIINNFLN